MLREWKYLHNRTLTTAYVNIPQHALTYAAVWSGWKRLNNRALAADEWTVWVSASVCVCVWACVRHLQWTHVALLPPPSWHTSYNICAPLGGVSFLFLFFPLRWRCVFCAHSLIVRLTYQPEMVTPGCLSPDVYHNVNSGLVNKIVINREHSSTWLIVGKLGQCMRCCECNSNSNVFRIFYDMHKGN